MLTLQQSPILREIFQQQVNQKINSKQQEINQVFGDNFLGTLVSHVYQLHELKNQAVGDIGEFVTSFSLANLPDSWIMCKNALIPTPSGKLTEIDLLLIGEGGVFLIEVKTWKGSFSAYQDHWKRREGQRWIPMDNSPTSQSAYHQKVFQEWITSQVLDLPSDFISAPVVFVSAQWLGVKECSVPVLSSFRILEEYIQEFPQRLTSSQVSEISRAITDYLPNQSKPVISVKPIPKARPIPKAQLSSQSQEEIIEQAITLIWKDEKFQSQLINGKGIPWGVLIDLAKTALPAQFNQDITLINTSVIRALLDHTLGEGHWKTEKRTSHKGNQVTWVVRI